MDKMILMAPALVAALCIAGCGAETATDTTVPAAAEPAVPAPAAGAVDASQATAADYAMVAGAPTAGHCALDATNGMPGPTVTAPAGSRVMFAGWAATNDKQPPMDALFVLANGTDSHAVPLVAGAHRPDVAAALGSEALAHAGYNLDVDLGNVPAGSYDLVIVLDQASSAHCSLATRLVLE